MRPRREEPIGGCLRSQNNIRISIAVIVNKDAIRLRELVHDQDRSGGDEE